MKQFFQRPPVALLCGGLLATASAFAQQSGTSQTSQSQYSGVSTPPDTPIMATPSAAAANESRSTAAAASARSIRLGLGPVNANGSLVSTRSGGAQPGGRRRARLRRPLEARTPCQLGSGGKHRARAGQAAEEEVSGDVAGLPHWRVEHWLPVA